MEISTKHHTKIYLIRNMVENSMFHLLQDDYIPMPERSRKKKTNAGESKRRRYTYTERERGRARGREGETCFNIL
jgi:hypothetical protein